MFNDSKIKIIGFDYLETSEIQQLNRRLSFLYSTVEGTVPGDRNFGLNLNFADYPPPVTENLFTLEIIKKTKMYEPNVSVKEVVFSTNEEGNLTPTIILEYSNDEVDEDEEDDEE